jgi:hypothetical protein
MRETAVGIIERAVRNGMTEVAGVPNSRPGIQLLAVIDQHLKARRTKFLAVLLQAGQNGEIALINHLAAEANRITRTSLLVLLAATVLRRRRISA